MKNILKTFLRKLGYEIKKLPYIKNNKGHLYKTSLSIHDALSRCFDRGTQVNSVIDIGASDGRWSLDCHKIYPHAQFYMIEAQEEHKIKLDKLQGLYSNFKYKIAAAGNEVGTIYFDNSELFGGTAHNEPIKNGIKINMTSIDYEVKINNLKPPYLIKLDTHGFEVPILEGAIETLKLSSLIIIECYNYRLQKDSLKYYELCQFMEERGFLPIEIADIVLRQYDATFWQMDLFFIPSSSKEFDYNSYR